jgi:tetratricopeptide (TPR) repeat protein
VWFAAGTNMAARGIHARRQALELGIDNAEAAARALMVSGREDDALAHRMLAVRLAPDLPAAHMALAREYWVVGEYRNSLAEVVVGIIAIPQHLEASIWLVGSLLMMLATVLIAGSLVFIVVVGVSTFGNAAHDVGDPISNKMPSFSRVALLCSVVLVPLVLGEGPMGLVIAIFAVGFVYLGSSHRMVMTMAVVLLVLGLYPILQIAGKVLTALEADPVATASLSVVRDMANDDQLELLAEAELAGDEMAARVLALYARRRGDRADAAERYGRLIRRDAADPLVLTTLGNMAFEEERTDEAIGYYERARALQESTVLMFNLSQAYAKAFRMEEFEHTMQRAQALGADEVMELSGVGDTSFVADMPFSISMIRDRMLEEADGDAFSGALVRVLAPGRLGESWAHMAGSFLFAALLAAIIAGRYQHASRCGRCGRRICARCDDSMWSSDLCDGCHHLFHRPQGTDPALRMARLQALRVRESRVEKVGLALSMIVPGASGLLAKRPDLCLIGILFFGWALVLFVWRNGVVADPLAVGAAGTLAFVLAGCVMAIGYVGVLLSGLVIRRSL